MERTVGGRPGRFGFDLARGEFYAGLIPTGGVLSGNAEYSTDLWDRETIEQWLDAYRELLCELVGGRVTHTYAISSDHGKKW